VNTWWRNIIEPGMAFTKANTIKNKGIGMKGKKVELTKVTRPRLFPTYQRTDLNNLLDELSATPLIMVHSKPGSGKTTLVSSYIENRDIPCLWYRLDRHDEDLAIFFYYLGIAALRSNPCIKTALPQVSAERVLRVPSLAKEYFHKLFQCIESPFMMVIDDYQELPKDAVLHSVITEACAALPPGGRIVLINNGDCLENPDKPPTHRATAILGCEELQLTPDEVKGIAALHGVRLSSDLAAKQLQMKTGGWVGGLIHELHELKSEQMPQEG
jgi:LuxR family maltose regulon positive regulatory protein